MLLAAAELIAAFLVVLALCVAALRVAGGRSVPLVLCLYLGLPLASLGALASVLELSDELRSLVLLGCAYFVLSAGVVRLAIRSDRDPPRSGAERFNPGPLYLLNIALGAIFVPLFARNLIESADPHATRIEVIQGLGFLFYPHFFLSLGIVTVYVAKRILKEERSTSLLVAFLVSCVSLVSFGGRIFPIYVIIGVLMMVDLERSRTAAIPILGAIFGAGLAYFAWVTATDGSLLERVGFRVTNSADIVYFVSGAPGPSDVGQMYPYDAWDLLSNPFRKLFGSGQFSSPGPYFFDGDGQGPLPTFLFDGFFYLGDAGYLYLLGFPIVFWFLIARSTRLRQTTHDGDRLFYFCLLFLPALHLMMDLATFNGFIYVLAPAFLLSRATARPPRGEEQAGEDESGPAPSPVECPEA